MQSGSSRRYLALWLHRLSTDRLSMGRLARQSRKDAAKDLGRPLAIVGTVKNARRLVALNDAAERAGLRAGMSFADACAILPSLASAEEAPQADARLLSGLADWCERYTPLVGLDPPDGLLFDITGVAHLFGGEAALAQDLMRSLARFGFKSRIGIADTVGAAFAMAHHGRDVIVPCGGTREALAPLPLAALRLPFETHRGLAQLGLKTIGDLMQRPRGPLTARFGRDVMRRLDQALGLEEEPISPRLPVPALSAEQGFAEPILRDEDVLQVIGRLTQGLCASLEKRDQGARCIMASVFGVDGRVFRLEIGTNRPLRDAVQLYRLFTDKFANAAWANETWDCEFGFDRIRVSVLEAETFTPAQKNLAQGEGNGYTLAHLIDRLSARLGECRVLRPVEQDTHVPEHACVAVPAGEADDFALSTPRPSGFVRHLPRCAREDHGTDSLAAVRPVKLFERPEAIEAVAEVPDGPPVRFKWRRTIHQIIRVEGPERIALPWWRDNENRPLTRDYFRVETDIGARLWLYRDGLYRETLGPRWFLHGFLP